MSRQLLQVGEQKFNKILTGQGQGVFLLRHQPQLSGDGRPLCGNRKMAEETGAETLILGCAELPLLFQHRSLPVPVLDTVKLHIQALLNAILEDPA